jgi:protein kinase-like protein
VTDWKLPGFTELTPLGAGGMGRVVLARRGATGEVVAIKYLHTGGDREAFRQEALLLRRVVSPHVARLHDFVESAEGAAIVMEAVPGVSLRAVLSAGVLPPESALAVLKGSLLGLAAAHAVGTVHRDYKPGNVLVQPNRRSKLVDFGIALLSGHSGETVGTPSYMAPEQWNGSPAAPATDVYAATCVFFLCVTGSRPFTAPTTEEVRDLHLHAEPPVSQVPEPLRPLVAAGMAKSLSDRPDDAALFVSELEEIAESGYGADWEAEGWEWLATTAGGLLAASPMAAFIAATGVLGSAASLVTGGSAGAAGAAASGAGIAGGGAAGAAATGAGITGGAAATGAGVAGGGATGAAATGAGVAGAGIAGAASTGAGITGGAAGGAGSAAAATGAATGAGSVTGGAAAAGGAAAHGGAAAGGAAAHGGATAAGLAGAAATGAGATAAGAGATGGGIAGGAAAGAGLAGGTGGAAAGASGLTAAGANTGAAAGAAAAGAAAPGIGAAATGAAGVGGSAGAAAGGLGAGTGGLTAAGATGVATGGTIASGAGGIAAGTAGGTATATAGGTIASGAGGLGAGASGATAIGAGGTIASGAGGIAAGAAGSAAGGAAAAVAAKVAAVVIAVVVIAGAAVITFQAKEDIGSPAGGAQALRVGTQTAQATYNDVNLNATAGIVQVSGHEDRGVQQAINDALRAPVNDEVNTLREQVAGARRGAVGHPQQNAPFNLVVTPSIRLRNDNFLSVRYENAPTSDLITNSSWTSYTTVTVDLRTGRALGPLAIFGQERVSKPTADRVSEAIEAQEPGNVCGIGTPLQLKSEDFPEHVQIAFTGDAVEFTLVLPLLPGYANACGIPTVAVPYDDISNLVDAQLTRELTGR